MEEENRETLSLSIGTLVLKKNVLGQNPKQWVLKTRANLNCEICGKEINNGEYVYVIIVDGEKVYINCNSCTYLGNKSPVKIPLLFNKLDAKSRKDALPVIVEKQ